MVKKICFYIERIGLIERRKRTMWKSRLNGRRKFFEEVRGNGVWDIDKGAVGFGVGSFYFL